MPVIASAPFVSVVKALFAPLARICICISDMVVGIDEARRNDGVGARNDGSIGHIGIGNFADFCNLISTDDDATAAIDYVFGENIAAQDEFAPRPRAFANVIRRVRRQRSDIAFFESLWSFFALPRLRIANLRTSIAFRFTFDKRFAFAIDASISIGARICFDPFIVLANGRRRANARALFVFANFVRRIGIANINALALVAFLRLGTSRARLPCAIDASLRYIAITRFRIARTRRFRYATRLLRTHLVIIALLTRSFARLARQIMIANALRIIGRIAFFVGFEASAGVARRHAVRHALRELNHAARIAFAEIRLPFASRNKARRIALSFIVVIVA